MQERIKPTRSGLFAIELLIAVGVFSLCAAICVGLFVRSEIMSQDSAALNQAVNVARSVADCFKAAGGDMEKTAELTGGRIVDQGRTIYLDFDEDWNRLSSGFEGGRGFYRLRLMSVQKYFYHTSAALEVMWCDSREDVADEAILYWDVAALEVAP